MTKVRSLSALHPEMAKRCVTLEHRAAAAGVEIIWIETFRSREQQADEYRKGRDECPVCHGSHVGLPAACEACGGTGKLGGKIVTRAAPGQSWHQWRRAADFALKDPLTGKPTWEDRQLVADLVDHPGEQIKRSAFEIVGEIAEKLGLEWGGRWGWDYGHVQYTKIDVREAAQLELAVRVRDAVISSEELSKHL